MASASVFLSLRLPTPYPSPSASSPFPSRCLCSGRRGRCGTLGAGCYCWAGGRSVAALQPHGRPVPLHSLRRLREHLAASAGGGRRGEDHLPFQEIFQNDKFVASPAQLMYLEWMSSKEPVYIYINSTGTARDNDEPVGMESEGFAIYDAMMRMKTEIHTLCIGAAAGHACLVLAAGKKGKRYMFPHAKAMIQQPRIPSFGMMQASDVVIRAKEVVHNRNTLVKLLSRHTGNVDILPQSLHGIVVRE